MPNLVNIIPILLLSITYSTLNVDCDVSSKRDVDWIEIQSCSGCQLNRLPEVKQFIFEDVPKYEGVKFKHISGAPPEMVLFDSSNEEIERIPLREKNRKECNQLLTDLGFKERVSDEL